MTDSEVTTEAAPLPLLAKPRNPRTVFVDTVGALLDAIDQLAQQSGMFALDAERASGFKYSQRAYLVQLTRGSAPLFLIDPIAITATDGKAALAQLATLLKTDTWILHAATQDLPCLNELGLYPSSLFDTELAGRLCGLPRVGLGAMVETFLQVRLAKEHSAVDWSTRPLASEWLNYAALDIDVLVELQQAVAELLKTQNKEEWAAQEFANLVNFKPKPQKPERWRATSGLHEVKTQKALAVARELWLAREELAKSMDVSPGRLIPDASITAVAKAMPSSRSELAGLKTFIGRASRSYLDTWWAALDRGHNVKERDLPPMKLAQSGMPNHRNWAQRFPEADARLNKLKPVMAALAEKAGMPAENLLTPDTMRMLCWQPPESISAQDVKDYLLARGARQWQADYCAEEFSTALNAPPSSTLLA